MQYGFNAKTQRGQPQPNTRFEQEATEETERWTMSSDALFSLFSPVQNILFQNQHFTAWRGAQAQTKTMPEGKGACRGAEVAEKDCMAHLLSCFFSALSAPLREYRAKGILVAAGRAAPLR